MTIPVHIGDCLSVLEQKQYHLLRTRTAFHSDNAVRYPPQEVEMPQEKQRTLLVVDDEPLMTELLLHMMSREGYRVLTAHSGAEALQIVRQEGSSVDLILLDINMPEMDGLQTARALQQEAPGIPVLIATGFGDILAESTFPANVTGVVSKPYQGKVIATRIDEIFQSTRGDG